MLGLATALLAFSLPAAPTGALASRRPRWPVRMQTMPTAAANLMTLLGDKKGQISFGLTMDVVEELYEVSEVAFSVGDIASAPGQNMGSAKIFSFAKLSGLEKETTLHLFGDYYRKDVLGHPEGDDHANIRAFVKGGWSCVAFPDGLALRPKRAVDANSIHALGPQVGDEYNTRS